MNIQPEQEQEPSKPETSENPEGSSPKGLAAPTKILGDAWNIFKNNIAVFVSIAAVPFLFSFARLLVKFLPKQNSILTVGVALIIGLASIVISFWSQIALFLAAREKGRISFQDAFSGAWGKVLSFWWIAILTSLIVTGGLLLFIIPGIIFGIWFSFSLFVFLNEDIKGFNALLKSRKYVEGVFGSILWRQFFFALVSILLILPVAIIGAIALGESSEIIVNAFSALVLGPLGIIYFYLVYKKVKKFRGPLSFSPSGKQKAGYIAVALLGFAALAYMAFQLGAGM